MMLISSVKDFICKYYADFIWKDSGGLLSGHDYGLTAWSMRDLSFCHDLFKNCQRRLIIVLWALLSFSLHWKMTDIE